MRDTDLSFLIATERGLRDEIGEAEGDIAHHEFEASLAELLGLDLDPAANAAALEDARRRRDRLRATHAAVTRRVEDALFSMPGEQP